MAFRRIVPFAGATYIRGGSTPTNIPAYEILWSDGATINGSQDFQYHPAGVLGTTGELVLGNLNTFLRQNSKAHFTGNGNFQSPLSLYSFQSFSAIGPQLRQYASGGLIATPYPAQTDAVLGGYQVSGMVAEPNGLGNIITSWTGSSYDTFTTVGAQITSAINLAGTASAESNNLPALAAGTFVTIILDFNLTSGQLPTIDIVDAANASVTDTGPQQCVAGPFEYVFQLTTATAQNFRLFNSLVCNWNLTADALGEDATLEFSVPAAGVLSIATEQHTSIGKGVKTVIRNTRNGTGSAYDALTISEKGEILPDDIHNNGGDGNSTIQAVSSGTYTATCTPAVNVTSVGNATCSWIRVGNVFQVSGSFTLDPDPAGAGAQVAFYMSLPPFITNNFAASNLGGTATVLNVGAVQPSMGIANETGGLRALFSMFNGAVVSNNSWYFTFGGEIQ